MAVVSDKLGSALAEQRGSGGGSPGLRERAAAAERPGCGCYGEGRGVARGWRRPARRGGANRVRAARRGSTGLRTVGELDHKGLEIRNSLGNSEKMKEVN